MGASGPQIATRRDGQAVIVVDPGAPQPRGQLSASTAAAGALAATRAAATVATAAPKQVASMVTGTAVNAAAAGILLALGQFLASRRADQQSYLTAHLADIQPTLAASDVQEIVSAEDARERAYAKKARERVARELPAALSTPDRAERRERVQQIIDRERRIAQQREDAEAGRVAGAGTQRALEQSSPAGAKWHLGEAGTHTNDCVAMAGKTWPHSVLRNYHPPLHAGCQCYLTAAPADASVTAPDRVLTGAMQMVHESDALGARSSAVVLEAAVQCWRRRRADVQEADWEGERRARNGRWFGSLAEAQDWARGEFGDWQRSLTPEQTKALDVYKHAGEDDPRYRQINEALRGSREWTDQALTHAPIARDALTHELSEPVIVHRADAESALTHEPGDEILHHAFTSTSLAESVAEDHAAKHPNAAAFLHLAVPAGTPTGYTDGIGEHPDEAEVLLPPGARSEVDSTYVDKHGRRHVEATLRGFAPREFPGGNA